MQQLRHKRSQKRRQTQESRSALTNSTLESERALLLWLGARGPMGSTHGVLAAPAARFANRSVSRPGRVAARSCCHRVACVAGSVQPHFGAAANRIGCCWRSLLPSAIAHPLVALAAEMAKRKIHSGHNVNHKAHKNGIKRPVTHKHKAMKGVSAVSLLGVCLSSASVACAPSVCDGVGHLFAGRRRWVSNNSPCSSFRRWTPSSFATCGTRRPATRSPRATRRTRRLGTAPPLNPSGA